MTMSNKFESKTPETERKVKRICGNWTNEGDRVQEFVLADVARKMEIERNAAIHELSQWSKVAGYMIGCLKSHHLTKPGIATIVKKAESMLQENADGDGRREPAPPRQ